MSGKTWKTPPGVPKTEKPQNSLRSSVPKNQVVFVQGGRSFTRYIENGKRRSTTCPHGSTCQTCFIEV
jgi:hypothetical protein